MNPAPILKKVAGGGLPGGPARVELNGAPVEVPEGAMASTAFLAAEVPCRVSVTGEPRTALCGMGICMECRAVVNGIAHQRTCQMACEGGMTVETMP